MADAQSLCQDALLARIYANRGVRHPDELDLSLAGLLAPEQLEGVAEAVSVLQQALQQDARLMIIGDYDADGATGTALAVRGLRALGFNQVDYLAPDRFHLGYGLSPAIVELALHRHPELIITVDNGISSLAGVAAANAAGVPVIITDHHLPGRELPAALAIVNPNLDGVTFASKALAGVGVMFYLLLGLRAALRRDGWFDQSGRLEPNLAQFTDLVALGTVADVVPLDRNNRILVAQGLRRIRERRCSAGVLALLEVAGRDPQRLVASDLGFAVAPRLNAAGRLDDMTLGVKCLLCDDPDEARRLAQQLDQMNRERRLIEGEMQLQAGEVLEGIFQRGEQWPAGVCLQGEDWHQGVVGILASRVKELIYRPVIAFAPGSDGCLKGSGRSVEGLHLRDTLDAIATRHPGLVHRFGGHAMAAGLSIASDDFDAFRRAFEHEVSERLGPEPLQSLLPTDGELPLQEFTLQRAESLREAGPWGQGFPEPCFDGWFQVLERQVVGQRHLRMRLSPAGSSLALDAIAFSMADRIGPLGQRLRAVYRLDVNDYRAERRLQLLITHIEVEDAE